MNAASYALHRLTTSRLPASDLEAALDTAPLDTATQIPAGTRCWTQDARRLIALPVFPRNIRVVDVRNNRLRRLSPESFRDLIENRHRSNAQGVHLRLQGNRFTTVPRFLLDLHRDSEINLQQNPIPLAERAAVRAEIVRREKRGISVPAILMDDDQSTNVHSLALVETFTNQIDRLTARFPDLNPKHAKIDFHALQDDLTAQMERHAQHHPQLRQAPPGGKSTLQHARDAVDVMCMQGMSGEAAMDFGGITAGHVLALVARTIADRPNVDRALGIACLVDHLRFARGYCSTRHVEEALTALQAAYPDEMCAQGDAATAVTLPFGTARDIIGEFAPPILRELLAGADKQPVAAVQQRFAERLRQTMHADGKVSTQQVDRYLADFVVPFWEEFCDNARDDDADSDEAAPLLPR